MKRKKILFIIPRFGTVNRGVESYAFELISRLDQSKHEISVLSTNHDVIINGVNFIKVNALKRERFKWLDQSRLLCKVGRALGVGSGADVESLSLCFNSTNCINQIYDFVLPLGGKWTYRFAHRSFKSAKIISVGQAGPVKSDLILSDIFIALTPYDENLARSLVKGVKTKVIPNGVDVNKFKPKQKKSSVGSEVSSVRILCVAALAKEKRHDLLFDAVSLLPKHFHVLCVGSGSHKEILEQHPLALSNRVKFKSVPYELMPDIYQEADIFSLASPDETFGIAFIEAIASGLPVVAHKGPKQSFVIGENGFLTDCFNAEEYSKAILSACELIQLPSQLPKINMGDFSWDEIEKKYEQLFYDEPF